MKLKWKRSVALLAALLLLLGCLPASGFAAGPTDTNVQAKVKLSQVEGSHYIVELQAKTKAGVRLAGGITWLMGYDNAVFELLNDAGASMESELTEDVEQIGNYVFYNSSEKHFDGIASIDGVIAAKDGSKSYISIYTTNLKGNLKPEDTAEYTTVLSYELKLKEGAKLSSDSLFFPAHTDIRKWGQAYQIYFSDGEGAEYIQGDANGTGNDDSIYCPIEGLPAEYELTKTAPAGDALNWADTLKTTGYQTAIITVANSGSKALTDVTATLGNGNSFTVAPASQLTLAAGDSASFTITPKASLGAGTYTDTISVKASGGADGTQNITIPDVGLSFVVTEWGFAPESSYTATYGEAMNVDLLGAVTGGTAPFHFSITNGTLPAGLSLAEAGTISGTPTAATAAEGAKITVKVTDSSSPVKEAEAELSIVVNAKAPEISDLTLRAGNKKIDAKWTVETNGAPATYKVVLSANTATQSAVVMSYEYLDETGAAKSVEVKEGTEDPTFTSGGALWITAGAASYPVATKGAVTVEVTPAGITTIQTETTSESAYGFTGLENGIPYTVTLTASNAAGDSLPVSKEATPKASSSGGGGGGSSSSAATTTGTDVKKELSSAGSAAISANELKNAKSIEAKNSQITIGLNQKAINAMDKAESLLLKAEKQAAKALSDAAKELIGSRPVFDITATQNGKAISEFKGGSVTITIAYTAGADEDSNKLFLYYINKKGEAERISGSKYDATLKAVTGQTDHLSQYAVGYDENASTTDTKPVETGLFHDISKSDWFYTAVMELAGKEILSGVPEVDASGRLTGAYNFRPQNNVTRAEFATMLAKAAGADLSQYSTKAFYDVDADDWYAGAVIWANSVGVASGTGEGSFSPNANITRQDMAVMVSKYLSDVAKTSLTEKNEKTAFTDASQIADYAKSAVESMQAAGVLSGIPNQDAQGNAVGTYQFRPLANATRAEAAAMLNGLLSAI